MDESPRCTAATQPDSNLQALKRLRATFKWRAQELPRTLRCTVCDANPKAHFMHVVIATAEPCWNGVSTASTNAKLEGYQACVMLDQDVS
jgi:hypothetical protein